MVLPISRRATKPFTAVTGANVLSVVFAAPLAAGIMHITALGLKGWQWLFILEGIPSVLLGIVMLVSELFMLVSELFSGHRCRAGAE